MSQQFLDANGLNYYHNATSEKYDDKYATKSDLESKADNDIVDQKLDANGWVNDGTISKSVSVTGDLAEPNEITETEIGLASIYLGHTWSIDDEGNSPRGKSVNLSESKVQLENIETGAFVSIDLALDGDDNPQVSIRDKEENITKYTGNSIIHKDNELAFPKESGTLALQEHTQDKLPNNIFSSSDVVWVSKRKGDTTPSEIARFTVTSLEASMTSFFTDLRDEINKPTNRKFVFDIVDGKAVFEDKQLYFPEGKGYAVLFNVARMYTMDSNKYASHIYATATTAKGSSGPDLGDDANEVTVTFMWTYPTFVKRISAEEGSGTTSAGPSTGIVTIDNYFNKWRDGYINSDNKVTMEAYQTYCLEYYKYNVLKEGAKPNDVSPTFPLTAATNNREVSEQTIAVRNRDGQLIVEDATAPFQAVNKRQLDSKVNELRSSINSKTAFRHTNVSSDNTPKLSFNNSQFSSDKAWVKIAESNGVSHFTELFNLFISGYGNTLCTFIVNVQEEDGEDATIEVLSVSDRDFSPDTHKLLIDEIAVACDTNNSTRELYIHLVSTSGNSSNGNTTIKVLGMSLSADGNIWTLTSNSNTNIKTDLSSATHLYTSEVYMLPKCRIVDELPTDPRSDTIYFVK